jgi:hypothetical protein
LVITEKITRKWKSDDKQLSRDVTIVQLYVTAKDDDIHDSYISAYKTVDFHKHDTDLIEKFILMSVLVNTCIQYMPVIRNSHETERNLIYSEQLFSPAKRLLCLVNSVTRKLAIYKKGKIHVPSSFL